MSKKILLLWVLTGLVFLAGCWDERQLGDIAFVMGVGIDRTEDGLYNVSFQVVNPVQVSGQKSGQGQGTAVTTYSETGPTIFETTRKLSDQVPRELAFSHTAVVIIGESLAEEEGLTKVLDFTERYYGFRSTALVLVARNGQAKPVLSILSPLERVPAVKIQDTSTKTAKVWGENPTKNINDVINTLSSKSKGLSINGISLIGNINQGQSTAKNQQAIPTTYVKIDGLAVFKDGKLNSWIDDKQARGVAWVQNEIKQTVITSQCENDAGFIAVEALRANTKLKAQFDHGQPKIIINIRGEGHLEEITCPLDLTKPEIIFQLNKQIESEIKQEVTSAVKIAQEQETDILGFGEVINRTDPKQWKQIKGNWNETFTDIDVNVNVTFFIRGTGLRKKPLIYQEEG